MRGKNIIWLSLIAMLIVPIVLDRANAAPGTVVRLTPSIINGVPGGMYELQITIENAYDLYAWGVDLEFAPLERVISPDLLQTEAGPFLEGTGILTYWQTPVYDKTLGQLHLGCTRKGPVSGANGNGILATTVINATEAGTTSIKMSNLKIIDSYGNLMNCHSYDAEYIGPTVNLVNKAVLPSRVIIPGTTAILRSKVVNVGTVPLYTRVRWDIIREDGVMTNLYAGQSYWSQPPPSEYVYCNGYTGHYSGWGWVEEGNAPYLDAVGDGNYVWGPDLENYYWDPETGENDYPAGFPIIGRFDFDTIALAGRSVARVALEAYTLYEYADTNLDLDTYAKPMGDVGPTGWIGSEWGTSTWGWHEPRWTADSWSDTHPALLTQAGIDAARIRYFMYWTADDLPHGKVIIDAIRLRIDFAAIAPSTPPWVIVQPGETMQMPDALFYAEEYDIATYSCSVFAEYRYYPPPPTADFAAIWNRGIKISPTFKIFVKY